MPGLHSCQLCCWQPQALGQGSSICRGCTACAGHVAARHFFLLVGPQGVTPRSTVASCKQVGGSHAVHLQQYNM